MVATAVAPLPGNAGSKLSSAPSPPGASTCAFWRMMPVAWETPGLGGVERHPAAVLEARDLPVARHGLHRGEADHAQHREQQHRDQEGRARLALAVAGRSQWTSTRSASYEITLRGRTRAV